MDILLSSLFTAHWRAAGDEPCSGGCVALIPRAHLVEFQPLLSMDLQSQTGSHPSVNSRTGRAFALTSSTLSSHAAEWLPGKLRNLLRCSRGFPQRHET